MKREHAKSDPPVDLDLSMDCPKCGFPARRDDRRCLYCGFSLSFRGGRPVFRLCHWSRFALRVLSRLISCRAFAPSMALFLLGLVLTAAGLALVVGLLRSLGGFTRMLAAMFLIAYGLQTLWASISSRRSRFWR